MTHQSQKRFAELAVKCCEMTGLDVAAATLGPRYEMPLHCLKAATSWVLEEEAPIMGPLTAPSRTVPLAGLASVPASTGTTSLPVMSSWQRWKCHKSALLMQFASCSQNIKYQNCLHPGQMMAGGQAAVLASPCTAPLRCASPRRKRCPPSTPIASGTPKHHATV